MEYVDKNGTRQVAVEKRQLFAGDIRGYLVRRDHARKERGRVVIIMFSLLSRKTAKFLPMFTKVYQSLPNFYQTGPGICCPAGLGRCWR